MNVFKDSMRKLLYALETQQIGSFSTNKLALNLLFSSTSRQQAILIQQAASYLAQQMGYDGTSVNQEKASSLQGL